MDKFVPKEPGEYVYVRDGQLSRVEVYRDNAGLWVRAAGFPVHVESASQRGTFHPGPIQPPEEGRG